MREHQAAAPDHLASARRCHDRQETPRRHLGGEVAAQRLGEIVRPGHILRIQRAHLMHQGDS